MTQRIALLACISSFTLGLVAGGTGLAQPLEPGAVRVASTSPGVVGGEVWIAARTDGKPGTGTSTDPLDGSSVPKFDGIMNGFYKANRKHLTIHLGVGTFETVGSYVYLAYDPSPGWVADDGWKIIGAGMGNTVVKLVGFTYLDPGRHDVSVAGGVWTTKEDSWFEVGDEIRLAEGRDLVGLTVGGVYHVVEALDAKRFRVAATRGGAALANAAIGAGGQYNVIGKSSANTAIINRPWNKEDIEVRDLTVDCNWTGFGSVLAEPFTVPADLGTVTVEVESSAWAQVGKWAYLQQADYKPVGVYEVVEVPGPKQIVLRNCRNAAKKLAPGQPDHRFVDNLAAGTVVPRGTRVCPRINLSGVGLSARRAKIERVRVTNVGAPIYEGECGINVVGIDKPREDWPPVSEVVVRDCVVDNIWGQYGWIIQVHGNNVEFPSRGFGTQALVEGNTIYGNGLHQGLGGWNYVNSLWVNNKVVNCTAAFFTDTPNCWNNIIRGNLFLDCKSWTVILGGGPGLWKAEQEYNAGDVVYWGDVNYTCKTAHKGHKPPEEGFWTEAARPAFSAWSSYVFDGNIFEISDNSGPLLFNGNVADTIFRNNILRYAPGQGKGSHGLEFSNPTNRRLIVTGNMIDSRLENRVDGAVVHGRDNVDETGKVRGELEKRDR